MIPLVTICLRHSISSGYLHQEQHFPEAKPILDLFHLKKAVWKAFRGAQLQGDVGKFVGRGLVELLVDLARRQASCEGGSRSSAFDLVYRPIHQFG